MGEVFNIDEHRPITPIYSIMVYKLPSAKIFATVDWADEQWIVENGTSVADRFQIIADATPQIAAALIDQANSVDE